MRRHTAIPIKSSAVAVLIMTGAVYMAAEARQAVIRKQRLEIARIENSAITPFNPINQNPISQTPISQKPISQKQRFDEPALAMAVAEPTPAKSQALPPKSEFQRIEVQRTELKTDELGAERQAASIPAQKPLSGNDGHKRQIVISISDRRLALMEDGKLVKSYRIAVGARVSPSPDGEFSVINHAVRPTYRHGGKEILPGKDNPLGTRWIGLSLKGYGIHGTNVPSSIGKAASHGCFRMGQVDVEDLYSRVQVGDTVTVRRERDELIARIFANPASQTETEMAANSGPTTEAAE